MTKDGRLLKISCIASLFVGLATFIAGIALAIGNVADMDAWMTTAQGLGAAVFGIRCSILANVPSNTSKIRGKAVAAFALAAITIAYLIYVGDAALVIQVCLAAVACLIAVFALVVSHRIVKEQLRK